MSIPDNLSNTSSWKSKRKTGILPFNLSVSNRPKKLNEKEESLDRHTFKARKIPKTHKVPFMVFHSTKELTEFQNPKEIKNKKEWEYKRTKIVVKTPYEELWKQKECSKPEIHPVFDLNNKNEESNSITKSTNSQNCDSDSQNLESNEIITDLNAKDNKYRKSENKMDTIDERHNSFDSEDSWANYIKSIQPCNKIEESESEEEKMDAIISQDQHLEKLLKDSSLDAKIKFNDSFSGWGSITSSMLDEASPQNIDMSNVFGGEIDIDKIIAEQN